MASTSLWWRAAVASVCAWQLAFLPVGQGIAFGQSKPGERELIAVLDVSAVGASKAEATAITDRIREELLKTGQFTVVDRSQLEAVLNEQALQQTGCTNQECAVQVGQILGVRKILSGRVTKVNETQWLIAVQLIDVETTETVRAESIRHRGDFFSLMDVAVVNLAGQLAGVAPQATATPLAKAEEESGGWPWWVWTLIGVGVLGAAAGGGGDSNPCPSGSGCGSVTVTW